MPHPGVDDADLGGTWLVAPSDDELRRRFAEPGFDDAGWAPFEVPGHWRRVPGLEACDGPVLHRRAFSAERPAAGRRRFVVFDGLCYQGDVWLDGSYLGDTEGWFQPHAFEVTEQLAAADEHVLAVELACPSPGGDGPRRALTGSLLHGWAADPTWSPGGIWRGVRLVETGPVALSSLQLACVEATAERARLRATAALDAADAGEVELRTTVEPAGVEHVHVARLAAGPNQVTWVVEVPRPRLWWPRALGSQPLVDVRVDVTPLDGAPSDHATRRTGLRQVRLRRTGFEVNGERLHLKGVAAAPTSLALAELAPEEAAADVHLAVGAGLDLLRLQGHVARPELYEAADAAGLLLWQDLPLVGPAAGSVRREAVRQATAMATLLGHHPSVALWCAHDDPLGQGLGGMPRSRRQAVRAALHGIGRPLLDASLARAVEQADGTRPVLARAGVAPRPGGHLTFGWGGPPIGALPARLRAVPALARLVGGFGAQAVPAADAHLEPARWPDLPWDELEERHGLQRDLIERWAPTAASASYEAWRDATQAHQAEVVRAGVEALRRLKGRPSAGFVAWALADPRPLVSHALLDHERRPKAGWHALVAACAPVVVTADPPPAALRPGQAVALDVHVASDLRHALAGCRVDVQLRWDGGGHRWAFAGDVGADAVVRVGTVSFAAPEVPGPLLLVLELTGPERSSVTYVTEVAAG